MYNDLKIQNLERLKYHIFIEDNHSNFLSENEINEIKNQINEEKKNNESKKFEISLYNYRYSIDKHRLRDAILMTFYMLFKLISVGTKGNFWYNSNEKLRDTYNITIAIMFEDVLLILFSIISLIITLRTSFNYKKIEYIQKFLIIYMLLYIIRAVMGILLLSEGFGVEDLKIVCIYEIVYLIFFHFLCELGILFYLNYNYLNENPKKSGFCLILCLSMFFTFISFGSKGLFWNNASHDEKESHDILIWIFMEDFIIIFLQTIFLILTIHKKIPTNKLLWSFITIFYFYWYISRFVIGSMFLAQHNNEDSLKIAWNFEIFYLIIVHVCIESSLIFLMIELKILISENFDLNPLYLILFSSCFLTCISLGSKGDFWQKTSEDMKSAYTIVISILILDIFWILWIIGLSILCHFFTFEQFSQKGKIKNLMIFFFIMSIVLFLIRFILGCSFLAILKHDYEFWKDNRTNISSIPKKIQNLYQSLIIAWNYEIFNIIINNQLSISIMLSRILSH